MEGLAKLNSYEMRSPRTPIIICFVKWLYNANQPKHTNFGAINHSTNRAKCDGRVMFTDLNSIALMGENNGLYYVIYL